MMLDDVAGLFRQSALKTGPRAFFLYFVFIFVLLYGPYAWRQNLFYTSPGYIAQKHREAAVTRSVFRWIRAQTEPRDLVAADVATIQKIFPLDRPIVSLPFTETLSPRNMEMYLSIYRPRCVLVGIHADVYKKYLEMFHYQLIFKQGSYSVFMAR